ncbi:MAG TPA: hypothetical protein ENN03_04605 [bacterium]|nr:hypothetical protein [bacterium]
MKSYRKILGVVFLAVYFFTSCLILLDGHNHENDGRFHDNCSACQWEAQAQDYDPIQCVILETIHNQQIRFSRFRTSDKNSVYFSDVSSTAQTRAPPFSTFS